MNNEAQTSRCGVTVATGVELAVAHGDYSRCLLFDHRLLDKDSHTDIDIGQDNTFVVCAHNTLHEMKTLVPC